jgi:diguanylate cyclase (GGDEF)-like protein/PAS domain S-box-containing protein
MPEGTQGEYLLRAMLEASHDAAIEVSLDGKIVRWNRGAERLYGYCEEEMKEQSVAQLVPLYEIPTLEAVLKAAQRGEVQRTDTSERLRKDGSQVSVAVRKEAGRVTGLIECARSLQHSASGSPSEQQLKLLAERMPVMLWTTDRHLRFTSNWGSGFALSGIGQGKLVGRTVLEFLNCDDSAAPPLLRHYEALEGAASRFEYRRGNRTLDIQLEPLRSPQADIIGCLAVDVTERRKSEDLVLYQAKHDALTDLANYREFVETFERELKRSDRTHGQFALLLLDLDGLKQINDKQGHLVGNRAIRRLADVMRGHCRSTDMAARYGGDEFALIMIDADAGMARQVMERITTELSGEREQPLLSVSIGEAIYPGDGQTAAELLETADKRLYQQKNAGRAKTATG